MASSFFKKSNNILFRCKIRFSIVTRKFCNKSKDNDIYQELSQLEQIKRPEFYEEASKKRHYFYYIDLQGRLFLEDTIPKTIATSLKSIKFLDFFWRNLILNQENLYKDYPYVSRCGKELNFIKVADSPIVFQDLQYKEKENPFLIYGGNLSIEFIPSLLGLSSNGRLYYRLSTKHLQNHWGLLKSHLTIELSQNIIFKHDKPYFLWNTKEFPIQLI